MLNQKSSMINLFNKSIYLRSPSPTAEVSFSFDFASMALYRSDATTETAVGFFDKDWPFET